MKLKNEDNQWVVKGEGLQELMIRYFEQVYSESNSDKDTAVGTISSRISLEKNELLLLPFSPKEIKSAIFSMHSDKLLGIDGLNPGFYRHF